MIPGVRRIQAKELKVGMWIAYRNSSLNERVVEVSTTRDGQIHVRHDFGHGGEPASSFYDETEQLLVI